MAKAGATSSGPPEEPNIVVVLADDVGFSDFGCYGSEIQTPNIDRLAANGIRFSQFLTENKCNPGRTSLMTGQYYIRGYHTGSTITIAEGLKSAGCRSYVSGKWDVVDDTPGGRPMRVGNSPSIMPGPEDTWQTYGPGWAFLSSTPFTGRRFARESGNS